MKVARRHCWVWVNPTSEHSSDPERVKKSFVCFFHSFSDVPTLVEYLEETLQRTKISGEKDETVHKSKGIIFHNYFV